MITYTMLVPTPGIQEEEGLSIVLLHLFRHIFYVDVCRFMHRHHSAHIGGQRTSGSELTLSFHPVGPRHQIQVIGLRCKPFCAEPSYQGLDLSTVQLFTESEDPET